MKIKKQKVKPDKRLDLLFSYLQLSKNYFALTASSIASRTVS